MKTSLITMICLLLAGFVTSCKNKENKDEAIDMQTTVTTNDTTSSSTSDMNMEDRNSGMNSNMNSDSNTGGTSDANSGSTRAATQASNGSKTKQTSTKGKKDNRKSGYSAADGTDAENHDGDQYTKNDTTRMPSGPPIK